MRYIYLGDAMTPPVIRGLHCDPVRNERGKCIVGRKGSALVVDATGRRYIVLRRRLRILEKWLKQQQQQQETCEEAKP